MFLETVAGVPGMVGAMVRHLRSLRHMDRDHGWIHTLLGVCMRVGGCGCPDGSSDKVWAHNPEDTVVPTLNYELLLLGA